MTASQRDELTFALRDHQRKLEQLRRALAELRRPSGEPAMAACEPSKSQRIHIEFTTAQVIRHRIAIALLASRLEASDGGAGYSHSIVAGGLDETS